MNPLDVAVAKFLNSFARLSWTLDEILVFVSNNHLLKGGVVAALLWWAWFRADGHAAATRRSLSATLLGSVAAMALARALSLLLPLRLRPIHDARLGFVPPYGMNPEFLDGWSSFPSDHAVLFFALATGLLLVSRRAGLLALLYSAFVIAFPRLYVGLHYLSDVLAGAALGVALVLVAHVLLRDSRVTRAIEGFERARPAWFYPAFFLLTFQIADMFESSREVGKGVVKLVRSLVS